MRDRFAPFVVALVLLLRLTNPLAVDPETALRDSIAEDVAHAWRTGDFVRLEEMAGRDASSRARTLSGKWRLAVDAEALSEPLGIDRPRSYNVPETDPNCNCQAPDPVHDLQAEQRWDALEQKLVLWQAARPHSTQYAIARCLSAQPGVV